MPSASKQTHLARDEEGLLLPIFSVDCPLGIWSTNHVEFLTKLRICKMGCVDGYCFELALCMRPQETRPNQNGITHVRCYLHWMWRWAGLRTKQTSTQTKNEEIHSNQIIKSPDYVGQGIRTFFPWLNPWRKTALKTSLLCILFPLPSALSTAPNSSTGLLRELLVLLCPTTSSKSQL